MSSEFPETSIARMESMMGLGLREPERYADVCYEWEIYSIRHGARFPARLFVKLTELMENAGFQAQRGSAQLLKIIENAWDAFSATQRAKLLQSVAHTWSNYEDEMSLFLFTELLGTKWRCPTALSIVRAMSLSDRADSRELAAHGFEHLAKCESAPLQADAVVGLHTLGHDPVERVRVAAANSLRALGQAG